MTTLREIENAVTLLPDEEYREFRQWFLEREWEQWDAQIESDSVSGKLDFLLEEATEARNGGRLRDL